MKRLLTYLGVIGPVVFLAVFAIHSIRIERAKLGAPFKPVIPMTMSNGTVKFIEPDSAMGVVGININAVPAASGTNGGTATCNWNLSPYCRVSATFGAGFINPTNPVDGGSYTIEIDQDSTGRTESLPTGTPFFVAPGTGGANSIVLSTAANNVEVVQLVFNAATGNYVVTSTSNTSLNVTGCSGTANPGAATTGLATVTNSCLSGATVVGCYISGPASTPGSSQLGIAPVCSVSSGTLTILITSTANLATPTIGWFRIK